MTAATTKKPKPAEVQAPVTQFAIVGFTPTCMEALPLLDDPAWHVCGMNNLHAQEPFKPHVSKFSSWFDLHPVADIRKDAQHEAWLKSGSNGVPVYVFDPQPDWPSAVKFPKEQMVAQFGRYFTNTVSWQLALFLSMLARDDGTVPAGSKIAIYGIDMATGTEYSAQRPSVEFFLGIAAGLGVEIIIPERSDLLKAAGLYGEADSGMLAKMNERREHLTAQLKEHERLATEHTYAAHQARGALEATQYVLGVWLQPNINRDNPVSQDGARPT